MVIAYLSEHGYLENENSSAEGNNYIQEDTFGSVVDFF
jgi:hypothetical protein